MTQRSSWKAFLRLSLVWVPVKAYPVAVSGDHPAGGARRPQFHQLHAECGCRIRHQKQCPRHGDVSADSIVSGYQYARDQYVVIDPAELDKLHSEDDRAITISEFIPPFAAARYTRRRGVNTAPPPRASRGIGFRNLIGAAIAEWLTRRSG